MALTKIKLDSMVTGTLPDANVPNDITITGLSGTNSGDNAVNTNYSGLAVTSTSVTDGTNTFNKATDFVSATSGGTFGGHLTLGSTSHANHIYTYYKNTNTPSAGWTVGANSGGRFQISEQGVGDQFIIAEGGNATFAGTITSLAHTINSTSINKITHNHGSTALEIENLGSKRALYVHSDVDSGQDNPLVEIHADNTGFDQEVLRIQNDGVNSSIQVLDNGSEVFSIANGGNATFAGNVYASNIYPNGSNPLRLRTANNLGIEYLSDGNGHIFKTYDGSWVTRMTIADGGTTTFTGPSGATDLKVTNSESYPTNADKILHLDFTNNTANPENDGYFVYAEDKHEVKWSVMSNGNTTFAGQVTATGIKFDGSGEVLDDYEEGTWTPTLTANSGAPSFSYDNRGGTYVRIGREVIAWFFVEITVTTSTGSMTALQANSLPFAPRSDNYSTSEYTRGGFVHRAPGNDFGTTLTWNSDNPSTAGVAYFMEADGTSGAIATGRYAGTMIYEAD